MRADHVVVVPLSFISYTVVCASSCVRLSSPASSSCVITRYTVARPMLLRSAIRLR